jgi:hypothetical protein
LAQDHLVTKRAAIDVTPRPAGDPPHIGIEEEDVLIAELVQVGGGVGSGGTAVGGGQGDQLVTRPTLRDLRSQVSVVSGFTVDALYVGSGTKMPEVYRMLASNNSIAGSAIAGFASARATVRCGDPLARMLWLW